MKNNAATMIMDLHWKNIAGIPMRYISHTFFARIENDHLIAPLPPNSYANILVEAPELPNTAIIQVSHKLDFYNLWILIEKEILHDENVELIIKHKPPSGIKKLMAAILPHLEYSVFYRGYLEAIHDPQNRIFALRQEPYAYMYDQERRVNVNDK
jgi:hypothetical protein